MMGRGACRRGGAWWGLSGVVCMAGGLWSCLMSDVCNLLMADGGWYVVAGRAANPRSPRGAWRGALRGGVEPEPGNAAGMAAGGRGGRTPGGGGGGWLMEPHIYQPPCQPHKTHNIESSSLL